MKSPPAGVLDRPDIITYLNEDAINAPSFAGWNSAIRSFRRLPGRPKLKDWLYEEYGVDLRTTADIRQVLQRMIDNGLPVNRELDRVINDLLQAAHEKR